MEVLYNNKSISNNEFLKVSETQNKPKIYYPLNDKLYTLIMYDPDAVQMTNNEITRITHIHFLITNIKGNDINTGNILLEYKGPAPPPKTGKHRYIFELYEEPQKIVNIYVNERNTENIEKIKQMLRLSETPLYKIQFISQNESGGKRKKTKRRKHKKIRSSKRRRIK